MPDRNTDRHYAGETADITYNFRRCIHAEQCIHRLASVFKKDARPWIDANGASAKEILDVVLLCPSGALHVERKDGTSLEVPPERNSIALWSNGPLQFHGALTIRAANGDVHTETRATLCRCGQSRNKPFCDNSHRDSGFQAADSENAVIPIGDAPTGAVNIEPERNGPYHVSGSVEILNSANEVIFAGDETWLCRCGHSEHKPFCDGTHNEIGFQAE